MLMMQGKHCFCFLTSLILFSQTIVCGQSPVLEYDQIYAFNSSDKINDVLLLSDGNLVAVGETLNGKSPSDGLLLIIDAENGTIINRKLFPKNTDNGLLGVTESGDATLYLVGYIKEGKKDKNPWWLRLDTDFNIIHDENIEIPGNNFFEKIQWLGEGHGIIAGWKKSTKSGEIWIRRIDGNTLSGPDFELGEGGIKKITGMETAGNHGVWICGNTQRTKKFRANDGWVVQLDSKGTKLFEGVYGSKFYEEVRSCSNTLEDGLILGGKSFKNGDRSDAWILKLDRNGQQIYDTLLTSPAQDYVAGILELPWGETWVDIKKEGTLHDNETEIKLLWNKGKLDRSLPITINNSANFEVVRLIRGTNGRVFMVGNMKSGNGNFDFRIVAFQEQNVSGTKGSVKLKASKPYLDDDNEDGVLSSGEHGSIVFDLESLGPENISNIWIKAEAVQGSKGFVLTRPKRHLPFLKNGKPEKVNIALKGSNSGEIPSGKIVVKISVNREEVFAFTANIEGAAVHSEANAYVQPTGGLRMSWQRPKLTASNGKREISVTENDYTIELEISSNRSIRAEDPRIYLNNKSLRDHKNEFFHLSEPVDYGSWLSYSLSYQLTGLLEEGRNEVKVRIDSLETSIVIYFKPSQPNLHILSIGPSYPNLSYTSKDARDFAKAFSRQKANGFFNLVYLDTLLSPQNTDKTSIKIALASLRNRAESPTLINSIKPNDYLVLFFSGHGIHHNEALRLVPSNYNPLFKEETTLHYQNEILDYLNAIDCKKIVFIDACHSGAIAGEKGANPDALYDYLKKANESSNGTIFITSSGAWESSFEDDKLKNGVFTAALLEALQGKKVQLLDGEWIWADQEEEGHRDNILTVKELFDFLQRRVKDLVTRNKKNKSQTPTLELNEINEDLAFFVY